MALKAPFPWFGGKSRAADVVWPRFGDTINYVEPFAGSLAILLKRPFKVRTETVNDADCYLSNFWRALRHDPENVAYHADWPVNEADLHARHLWLVNQDDFREQIKSDPDYYDAKIAGWWVWGLCSWIGGGWCSIREKDVDKKRTALGRGGRGIHGSRPNLRPAQGVHRQLPALGRGGRGVNRPPPHLSVATGQGISAKHARTDLLNFMNELSSRLRNTRVCCGDWTRVMGKSVTYKIGTTAVFLDPPYNSDAKRASDLYAVDDESISTAVREWALENGDNKKLRIALCGHEAEHGRFMPRSWECIKWHAAKGYAAQNKKRNNQNRKEERIWFSPHCLKPDMARGIVDDTDYSDLFNIGELQE